MTPRRVAIVGGGLTGLAAAWELSADPGVEVVVLEAEDRFGGKVRTSTFAGRPVDEGADGFLRRVPDGLALAAEVGIADQLVVPAARGAHVWVDDHLAPLPGGLVIGVPVDLDRVAASGVLSAAGVDRMRREPDLPGEALHGDESVGSLIRRRYGDEVLDRLVGPLVGGINAGEPDEMSVASVLPQIAAAAARGASLTRSLGPVPDGDDPVFATPRGGMGVLVDELVAGLAARGVDLRVGTPVAAIEPAARWRLHAPDAIDADAVVLGVHAPTAGRLVAEIAPEAARLLADVRHASVALVSLAYRREDVGVPLDASGFLVPRDAGLTITAASWTTAKWAHLDVDDQVVLRVSAGHHHDPAPVHLDDEALLAVIAADLERTMGIQAAPGEVRIGRYVDGLPQYAVGHLDRVAAIDAELRDRAPGLVATGMAFRGVGIPACIRQGRLAAREALAGASRT